MLASDDWDDLSARSGGSGPTVGARGPVMLLLLLLLSSLAWGGWLRLGTRSSPGGGTESDAVLSATRRQKKDRRQAFDSTQVPATAWHHQKQPL